MSWLLAMGLLSQQRKLRKKRARRTRKQIQPRPEMTMVHRGEWRISNTGAPRALPGRVLAPPPMEELEPEDYSFPAHVDFPDGMADGVKEPVHAPEREKKSNTEDDSDWEVISDGSDGELYTVVMKEEWEFYKRAREKTPNRYELLKALSNEDYYEGIRVAAVEFLNKALGISNGSDRYRDFMCNEIRFGCRLFDDQYELVLGHEDVKKVIPRPEFPMGDILAL